MKTIFVNIASYLDHQVLTTLHDLLIQAKYPDRLHVCIIHQHDNENIYLFEEFDDDPRVTIINMHFKESRGACYARHLGNKKYKGEDYVLMIDSHSRFMQDWDEEFIAMHNRCLKTSKKACISSYCSLFDINSELSLGNQGTMLPSFKDNSGVLRFRNIQREDNELRQHAFWGACLSFSDGKFFQEVPYDPELYFFGEEISIALRAWTRGWDFYLPDKFIIEHDHATNFLESRRIRHSDSNKNSKILNSVSLAKVKKICNGKVDGIFGHGNIRSIQDYESAAGISFKDQYIWHDDNILYRPFPAFNSYKEFSKHIIKNNRLVDVVIDWSNHKDLIKQLNYDFMSICIYWDGREIFFYPENEDSQYSMTIKDIPVDILSTQNPTMKEVIDTHNIVEIFFYKEENNNIQRNTLFSLNTDINIYFNYDNIDYHYISKNVFGYYWLNIFPKSFPPRNCNEKSLKKILNNNTKRQLENSSLFIHIPKCAGTTFKAMVHAFLAGRDIRMFCNLICPSMTHISVKDTLYEVGMDCLDTTNIIAIFRNPYDRLYSSYCYGFKHKGMQESKSIFFEKKIDFNSFCKKLYDNFREGYYFYEYILRPQYSFIEDTKGNINNCYLMDFANLNKEWDKLCIKYNLENKPSLLKNNISSNRNKDFMSVYNKESLKIVEKIYEKDINIYKQLRSGDYKCQKLVEKNSHILKKV